MAPLLYMDLNNRVGLELQALMEIVEGWGAFKFRVA